MMEYRETCYEHHPWECWVCGEERDESLERSNILVHHIRTAGGNESDNLVPLCTGCHGRVHSHTPQGGDIEKLQAVLWESSPIYPQSCALGDFVFEGGELRFETPD